MEISGISEIATSRRYTPEKARKAYATYGPAEDLDGLFEAKSARTVIQYGSSWRIYKAWVEAEEGRTLLPCSADQLLHYLRYLRDERNLACTTIEAYVGAIGAVHKDHGRALDRTKLVAPIKALRRKHRSPKRAAPLLGKLLRAIVDRLDPGKPREVRDGALLLLAFAGALRSAEMVGLDLERMGSPIGGATGALVLGDDETVVDLETSKTSQLTAQEIVIPAKEMPSLRVWLDRWIELAGVRPGEPVFRPVIGTSTILPRRLSSETVLDIVRRRVRAHTKATGKRSVDASAVARTFSSHSPRRGYCTTADNAKVPRSQIRGRSRHRSDEMLGRYIAAAETRRESGLKKVGF